MFAYNAAFEIARIKELANRYPQMKQPLLAISTRIIDLLRIALQNYYNPIQQGSWSIKSVLPAIAPDLRYESLEGVQDGGIAMEVYLEAVHPQTSQARKDQIREQLLAYCGLDTLGMVRLWKYFTG